MVARNPTSKPLWFPPAPRRVKILAVFDGQMGEENATKKVSQSPTLANSGWVMAMAARVSRLCARWFAR